MRRTTRMTLFGCALFALAGRPGTARADAPDVAEAKRLADASSEDWYGARYADAVAKLRRALAIYERAGADHVGDVATTERALVWNLMKLDDAAGAQAVYAALLDAAAKTPSVEGEMWVGYRGLYEGAREKKDLAKGEAILRPVRELARARKRADVASQVLHDLGGLARDAGAPDRAATLLGEAIAERQAAGDLVGLTWSSTNLANLELAQDHLDAALPPLLAAHRLVAGEGVVVAQAAVTVNLWLALEKIEAGAPDARRIAWVWDVADVAAKSTIPPAVTPDVLLRRAASAQAAGATPAAKAAAARRLADAAKSLPGAPVEVVADLRLAAARWAVEGDAAADAWGWLDGLDVGTGLCKPYLAARLAVERARAAGALKKTGPLTEATATAREALRTLAIRDLSEASLPVLAAAARAGGVEAVAVEVDAEIAALRKEGRRGGQGASATGGGAREAFDRLGAHDPVFELHAEAGQIVLRDLLDGKSRTIDATWSSKQVAFHGFVAAYFGGYVRLHRLDYAEGAVATGGGGEGLDPLAPYLPIPAQGVLHILKNGAIAYPR